MNQENKRANWGNQWKETLFYFSEGEKIRIDDMSRPHLVRSLEQSQMRCLRGRRAVGSRQSFATREKPRSPERDQRWIGLLGRVRHGSASATDAARGGGCMHWLESLACRHPDGFHRPSAWYTHSRSPSPDWGSIGTPGARPGALRGGHARIREEDWSSRKDSPVSLAPCIRVWIVFFLSGGITCKFSETKMKAYFRWIENVLASHGPYL
jgi:hypothetical protein